MKTVQVSPTRDRVGRVILTALGGAAVVAGSVGAIGVHSLGPRLVAIAAGLGVVSHGLGLMRIARRGEVPGAKSTSQRP